MKPTLILLSYACCLLPLALPAAVPLTWTVETSRATPATFEAYQGETIQFEAALMSNGRPLEMSGLAAFFWQTNGMGSAYWQTSAAVNSNRLSAVFTPEMDVGAKVYNCFIGSPSNIYHAAFQLRLRPSPGATPNVLPLPVPILDFAKVRVLNPPWPTDAYTRAETDAKLASAAVSATNYTDSCYSTLSVSVARLESATNDLASSVSRLRSSKLDRGEKVALSAVTNAQGSAVTAADVGALPSVDPYDQAASVYWGNSSGTEQYPYGLHVVSPYVSFDAALEVYAPHATLEANWGKFMSLYVGSQINAPGINNGYCYFSQRYEDDPNYIDGHIGPNIKVDGNLHFLGGDKILFEDHDSPQGGGAHENLDQRISRLAPPYTPDSTDPTFSNAVLAVGLNIDTNSVAVLNEIAATIGGFPITGTATTVGGLLAALAAAVAWLRKHKIDKLKVTGMTAEATADNGVAKLDDFFKESNTLLTGVIDARLPYPLNTDGTIKDRAVNVVTSGAFVIPEGFKDLLIRYTGVPALLTFSGTDASIADYGDDLPTETGDYLITVSRIKAAECYIRIIKLEARA